MSAARRDRVGGVRVRCFDDSGILTGGSHGRRFDGVNIHGRLVSDDAVDAELKTATTDNGREVSYQRVLERILGCPVYYTRAYASYEKGAVENVNCIVRRWFPKETDFSKVPREDVLAVKAIVNSIYRRSLKRENAYDYHSRLAKKI